MSVHFSRVTPILIVERIEPTRAFFCDRLGFTVRQAIDHGDGPGYLRIARGDVSLIIRSEASVRAEAADDEDFAPDPYAGVISIDVANVDAFVAEVADADVVIPLRRSFYGAHEIGVREPGGNVVLFSSQTQ
jgi:uncharacterized glyoxalase superfamily protein PhnB